MSKAKWVGYQMEVAGKKCGECCVWVRACWWAFIWGLHHVSLNLKLT